MLTLVKLVHSSKHASLLPRATAVLFSKNTSDRI